MKFETQDKTVKIQFHSDFDKLAALESALDLQLSKAALLERVAVELVRELSTVRENLCILLREEENDLEEKESTC